MIKFIRNYFDYIIFSFFTASIFAWCLEIIYSLLFRFKFVLPGTLSGPWCPVYGATFICLLLFVRNKDNKLINFIKIFLIAVIIEYVASFISDEIFNHVIWDYSNQMLNINGRVCLPLSFLFSILGYFILYYIEPIFRRIYIRLNREIKIINSIFIFLFLLDILVNIFWI